MSKNKVITEPLISFRTSEGNPSARLALWAGNPGDVIHVSDYRPHIFAVSKTASLVYEDRSVHGHMANEVDLNNPSTWKWIEKWMERGMIAEGHLKIEHAKHWESDEAGKLIDKESAERALA